MLIDAHIHFWQPELHAYVWMPAEANHILRRAYLPGEIAPELNQSGVAQAVAVQASNSLEETVWLLDLADEFDFISAVVGWVDLSSEACATQLDKLQSKRKFVGVRHLIEAEADDDWVLQPTVKRNLRELATRNLTFDLLVRPPHLRHLPELFAACPDTRFALDHLAKPDIATREFDVWGRAVEALARHGNLFCKLSGWHTLAPFDSWTNDDFKIYFAHALECFTASRLMFGSDYPVCLQAATYRQTVETLDVLTRAVSENERQQIRHLTAEKFYRTTQRHAR